MAREVLYRRSFHSDRDLKGMESSFGLDRARKVSVAEMRLSTADGGFEAPRNSLDVPFSGLLEMRRNSEVRNEEIPIGYELSRSLTTRRRSEEYSNLKPVSSTFNQIHMKSKQSNPKINPELDHRHRAPSVVARLMGLDALPHHQDKVENFSSHSSLRRIEDAASSNVSTHISEREICSEEHSKEKLGYRELPFRNHPQEKQLQEFKREFTARQALQERHSMSRLNLEGSSLQEKREQLLMLDPQMDSEEFLDALNFLNANKDFFVKVLNDPHSSFAKHLQQPGGPFPSIENGPNRQAGGKLTRSFMERNSLSFTDDQAEWKKQDLRQSSVIDKSKTVRGSRWGRDEEMPGRYSRWRGRGGSLTSPGRMGLDQIVPTRIVVLKPNLSKQSYRKLSTFNSSSPVLTPSRILTMRLEGKENLRQELRQEMKERTQLRNDAGLTRDFARDDIKDGGSKDARIIAKQIVKHAREDTSHRLLKDDSYTMDLPASGSCSTGRKAPAQKFGCDASSLTDNGKISSNLPSLSYLSKNERQCEHRQVFFNGRRGSHTEDSKLSSHKNSASSSKNFREPSKLDESMLGNQDSCIKQGMRESKTQRKASRSNSFKVRESKCEAPRVLPRSLSAPAAALVENREGEQKGGGTLERATCLNRARSGENSPFKERLLSLKDSFSLTKKRGNKKPSSSQCSSPPDVSELSTPRQLTLEQGTVLPVERKEACQLLPGFEWQTSSSPATDEAKSPTEKSLNEVLSGNTLPPSGLQWPLNADLVDTASETSLDKCEQPSPVSVLETPFQEESPSSVDKRETDSECHGLRCGVSRLKAADFKDFPRNLHAEFFSQPSSCHNSSDCLLDEALNICKLPEAHLISYHRCEAGSEEEMMYIMHVLSLSGLNMNGLITAHSLITENGLNPSIFGRLEAYYERRSKGVSTFNTSSRRLLFDVVDEVVASSIKRRISQQPWAYGKSSNQKVVLCTGKQLLEQIFTHISYHRYVSSEAEEEVLEDMASKDLMREAPWVPLQCDTQSVVIELERLLCGDLIREIVHECVRR